MWNWALCTLSLCVWGPVFSVYSSSRVAHNVHTNPPSPISLQWSNLGIWTVFFCFNIIQSVKSWAQVTWNVDGITWKIKFSLFSSISIFVVVCLSIHPKTLSISKDFLSDSKYFASVYLLTWSDWYNVWTWPFVNAF